MACGQDIFRSPPSAGEQVGEITFGEMFAVLPFGNSTVIETLTYDQLMAAFVNGFKPPCGDVAGGTGRTPQFAGLKVTFHCNGTVAVIDSIVRLRDNKTLGRGRHGPPRHQRLHVHGGDGYTALSGARTSSRRATCCSTWRSTT